MRSFLTDTREPMPLVEQVALPLREHPGYLTLEDIRERTGLDMATVSSAIYGLIRRKRVELRVEPQPGTRVKGQGYRWRREGA